MHNHDDRGTLHSDCSACNVLAGMLVDAGMNVTYPQPTHDANPWYVTTTDPTDTTISPLTQLYRTMRSVGRASGKTALASMLAHCIDEHMHPVVTEMGSRLTSLADVTHLHAMLHATKIGHYDSLGAEHLVPPASREKIESAARLADQKHWSGLNKGLKAEQHARRTKAAQEQRTQVQLDSAHNLNRAVQHALGTIVPRLEMNTAGLARLQVGQRKPLTIATINWAGQEGVGTALCRPGDRWDAQIGYQLAIARAFSAFGASYEAQWLERERNR